MSRMKDHAIDRLNEQRTVTICPPSNRNKPKSYIKCSNPCPDIRYGSMTERKAKVEQEITNAVDEQLLSLR